MTSMNVNVRMKKVIQSSKENQNVYDYNDKEHTLAAYPKNMTSSKMNDHAISESLSLFQLHKTLLDVRIADVIHLLSKSKLQSSTNVNVNASSTPPLVSSTSSQLLTLQIDAQTSVLHTLQLFRQSHTEYAMVVSDNVILGIASLIDIASVCIDTIAAKSVDSFGKETSPKSLNNQTALDILAQPIVNVLGKSSGSRITWCYRQTQKLENALEALCKGSHAIVVLGEASETSEMNQKNAATNIQPSSQHVLLTQLNVMHFLYSNIDHLPEEILDATLKDLRITGKGRIEIAPMRPTPLHREAFDKNIMQNDENFIPKDEEEPLVETNDDRVMKDSKHNIQTEKLELEASGLIDLSNETTLITNFKTEERIDRELIVLTPSHKAYAGFAAMVIADRHGDEASHMIRETISRQHESDEISSHTIYDKVEVLSAHTATLEDKLRSERLGEATEEYDVMPRFSNVQGMPIVQALDMKRGITEPQYRVVGELSWKQILPALLEKMEDLNLPLEEFRTKIDFNSQEFGSIHKCTANITFRELLQDMATKHIHRFYIVDEDEALIDIVTVSDILVLLSPYAYGNKLLTYPKYHVQKLALPASTKIAEVPLRAWVETIHITQT